MDGEGDNSSGNLFCKWLHHMFLKFFISW